MRYDDFIKSLGTSFPELPISDPDLPHVALGMLVGLMRQPSDNWNAELARRIAEFVERAASSPDKRLQDLVMVSFIENLGLLGERCHKMFALMGPRTSALAAAYERKWGTVCQKPQSSAT